MIAADYLKPKESASSWTIEVPDYIYIFEFKLDGTAAEALAQIEEKGYARPYASDPRPLYRIGVSFSSETGTVDDWAVAE